ncbi:hypothetical protein [Streptomyces roseicoloratus]|uniref:hypothetical protein n=1 Tax=Streptomyces roseicoloratus TaxID=2508722 RepID=UPI001009DC90|nr:hypothetical protein [Streptomyces roseicoloratus]
MDGGSRKRRRGLLVTVIAGATIAAGTGIGLWATDTGPFRDAYCWGTWQEHGGPGLLGDEPFGEPGFERHSTESAPPAPGRPQATCTVEVAASDADDDDHGKVTLTYGAVPAGAEERRKWISDYLHGSATPLPDGVPGLVAGDRGMIVLPAACDADGRPVTVTMWSDDMVIGRPASVGRMLVDAANQLMKQAGCAPGEELRMTSPLVKLAEDSELANKPLCRIPGLTFTLDKTIHYREQVGTVGDGLQTCSAWYGTRNVVTQPGAQFVMAGEPRMAALFTGLPEGADKGLVRARCDGRETVFYGDVQPGLQGHGQPDDRRVFQNFVTSVSKRIGCGATGGETTR